MSFQALNWAVRQRVGSPISKGIVMALANYADERGTCFPSHERIVRETELSDKTVRTHLKRLEDLGILESDRVRDVNGRLCTIRYRLSLDYDFYVDPDETKGHRKTKAAPDDGEPNEAETPPVAGTAGSEPGTAGEPPVSEGENPPVAGTGITLSKITKKTLSQTSSPEPRPRREREISPSASSGQTPESDALFDALATLWPAKDNFADARDLWGRMDDGDREAAARYGPVYLAELRSTAGRKHIEQLVKWLRGQSWRYWTPPKPVAAQAPLEPFSRPWWAEWWRRLAAGEKVSFMGAEAVRGKPWSAVPPADADMVAVEIGLPAFAAWQQAVEERGAKIPIPDKVKVIWVPCAEPADWHPETVEAAA